MADHILGKRQWIHIHFSESAFAFCGCRFAVPSFGTRFLHFFLLSFRSLVPLFSLSFSFPSLHLCLLPFSTWSRDLFANMATAKRVILNLIWPLTHSKCQQQWLQQHHHHLLLLLLYPLLLLSLWMLHHVSVVAVARLPWWDASRQLSPACPVPPSPPSLSVIRKSNFCAKISALLFCKFNENANEQSERRKEKA